jgi:hypothetical protein
MPPPNVPAVNLLSDGGGGLDETGVKGWQSSALYYGQAPGNTTPSIYMLSAGGTGGTGSDGGNPTGNGGQGGDGNLVELTIGSGAWVNSSNVSTANNANAAVWLQSLGGNGATAGKMSGNNGHPGQPGGGGSSYGVLFDQFVTVASSSGWNNNQPGTIAVLMQAIGGNAANPLPSDGASGAGKVTGAAGNTGGNGGYITYNLHQGGVSSQGAAVVLLSQGGQGGDGTGSYSDIGVGVGGAGGAGGNGGNIGVTVGTAGATTTPVITAVGAPTVATGAVVPIDASGGVAQAAVMAAGIQAQSIGGIGGNGGEGDGTTGSAGAGGAAGGAGNVTVALNDANISTNGFAAAGVLAQSIGGAGGNGSGAGGIFSRHAGNGAAGGAAGAVAVTMGNLANTSWPSDLVSTSGDDSMGVVAQSIGGGGGTGGAIQGGSVFGGVAIGGDGETGGNAATVTLNNGALAQGTTAAEAGFIVATQGEHSSGLVAQSIGGGGGTGGSASNTVLGPFTYTVGGKGGSGGGAGTPGTTQVSVLNRGIVNTSGDHAKGMVAQAVGGGGGDGGSASAMSTSVQLDVNVTVGGSGGSGGTAGDVQAINNGELLTSGADAWGMLAQSVSGGGGNGGSSASDSFLVALPEVPSLDVNLSVGGNGGGGAASGNVTANNSGIIMTAGADAHGLLAQSIAGGGGNGGDASALTIAAGKGTNIIISAAVGGSGGSGGTAGNVTVDNAATGTVWTLGDSSDGIFAQSVGGGGGSGGVGKETDKFVGGNSKSGGSVSLALGGTGGTGGTGGAVVVTNEGNIMTMGDSSNGIFAQSVGGGGGVMSGGTAKDSAGKQSQTETTSGGSADDAVGGNVTATNNATILTYGGDAAGIYAQSVGGGGGKSGSTTTSGLPTGNISLSNYLASSPALKGLTASYAGVQAWSPAGWQPTSLWQMEAWANDYLAYAAANSPAPVSPTGGTLAMTLALGGGSTGASTGGDGGTVVATNNFDIETRGPASPGVFAQSIGAGGGQNGATNVNQIKLSSGSNSGTVTITQGGTSDNNGNGGSVTINNNAAINTTGDASFGAFAQSVGGGGGETIATGSSFAGSSTPVTIALGGSFGTEGNGGTVTVNQVSGANQAAITTTGNDAVGIVAQSVGGSGGNAVVMQTVATTTDPTRGTYAGYSQGAVDELADPTGTQNSVTVGGNQTWNDKTKTDDTCIGGKYVYAACGTGGTAAVTTSASGNLTTTGRNAHGVLAQSIGGGGGWIVGLTEASDPFDKPISYGAGGAVNLTLGGTISTKGDGAYGVLAQSVGAGGVLGGDLAAASTTAQFSQAQYNGLSYARSGSGGNVAINNAGSISTLGANAHAIFAQSVGGGGGLYATKNGMLMGTAGGEGDSGAITITNSGTVQATGSGASAIYVNSQGHSDNSLVAITNANGGAITGNITAPAIMLTGGNSNGDGTVNNAGIIIDLYGTAIAATSTSASFAAVTNSATGVIYGDLNIGSKGTFDNYGSWGTTSSSTVGTVNNYGQLIINGASGNNTTTPTVLNGSLNNNGQIQATVDFYNQTQSYFSIGGNLNIGSGSSLYINSLSLVPGTPVPVLGAATYTGIATLPVTDAGGNYLFNYSYNIDQYNNLNVWANSSSHFKTTAQQVTSNENLQLAADYLDAQWTTGASQSLAQIYAKLASVANAGQYVAALQSLDGEGTQAASVSHLISSNAFVERMNSCPRFDEGDMFQHEHDCLWGRVVANSTDRDSTGDSVGYHQNGQVFQMGGQREVAPDWFVGASVSSDHSNLDTGSIADSINGHGWTAGLVAKHQMGDWLVSGSLEGGEMSYSSTRQANLYGLGGTAHASFDVTHWGLHSRTSRQFVFDHWYLKPYIDVNATRIDSDGYTEKGAGALDLRLAGAHSYVFGASPMVEAGSRFDFANGVTLQLYAGLGGTFYNQDRLGADAQLADAPGPLQFHQSSDIPRDRFKGTAGLDLKANKDIDIRLEYQGEFASHFQSNTGALKFTYKF